MTWYRVGPAGIPGSLKTDMDAVLNKKFGTSTTYAPNTWPDNVNLLGPLPVKTASGAIVSFSDGADDVPLASASFGIVPAGGGGTPSDPVAITGYSGMTITHTDGQTPPVESETISDTFGRTVYGGTRALDGTLTETWAKMTFNGTENWRAYTNQNGVFLVLANMLASSYVNGLCNIFSTAHSASDITSLSMTFGVNNGVIYINHLFDNAISGVTDVATWKTWLSNNTCEIVFPLATENTYALDPLTMSSYYGDNDIYTDIPGATNSVDYRADIQLALNA